MFIILNTYPNESSLFDLLTTGNYWDYLLKASQLQFFNVKVRATINLHNNNRLIIRVGIYKWYNNIGSNLMFGCEDASLIFIRRLGGHSVVA